MDNKMKPTLINNFDTVPINIFWHIYIDSKRLDRCESIVQRQFQKIKESGLFERCENIYIGLVNDKLKFPFKNIIESPKVKIISKKRIGYEGVTNLEIKNFCNNLDYDSFILYIHNRGSTRPENEPTNDWTKMLEYFTIINWKKSIELLKNHYTAGCELSYAVNKSKGKTGFHYSGNFWWVRSEYIKLLENPDFKTRFSQGEFWILQLADKGIKKENFGILHRTSEKRYDNGIVNHYVDRYTLNYYEKGNEVPDIELDKTKFHGKNCSPEN